MKFPPGGGGENVTHPSYIIMIGILKLAIGGIN